MDLEDGKYILSLRDEILHRWDENTESGKIDYTGRYTLGAAKASISKSLHNGGHTMLNIAIESPNVPDFVDLYNEVYARLGMKFEALPTPERKPTGTSAAHGVRIDRQALRTLTRISWGRKASTR